VILVVSTGLAIAASETFVCSIDDAVFSDGGKFGRTESSEFWRDTLKQVIVDTNSGLVGFGQRRREAWSIVQTGSGVSDFIARSGADGEVRIRLTDGRPTFVYAAPFQFYTGTCSVVR
jgi:hypothetical protein